MKRIKSEPIYESEAELDEALKARPPEIKIANGICFNYVLRRFERGDYRIFAMDVAKPGEKWRWGFDLIWPAEKELL